jgi:hypothetical protein
MCLVHLQSLLNTIPKCLCVCTGSIVVWSKLNVKLHSTPLTLKIIISVLVGLNFNNHLFDHFFRWFRSVLIIFLSVLSRGIGGEHRWPKLLTRKLLSHGFIWVIWSHHFESFTVATTTWLIVMEYLCHKEPRLYSTCRKYFPVISSFMTCSGTAHPSVALEFTPVFLGFVLRDL